jgi:hypothetical protein
MKDYRPYVKLFQLSRKYSRKLALLNGGNSEDQKTLLIDINNDFNNSFWHKYKHLFAELNPVVKEDVNNIFSFTDIKNGIYFSKLSESLRKAEADSKNELPEYLSHDILEEIEAH